MRFDLLPIFQNESSLKNYLVGNFRRIADLFNQLNTEDPWHQIGATGEPAFQNSWQNWTGGGAYAPARFRRVLDVVQVQGLIEAGTIASTIFTLPTGYRPSKRLIFIGHATTGHARLDVDPNGNYEIAAVHNGGSNAYVSINVMFSVAA